MKPADIEDQLAREIRRRPYLPSDHPIRNDVLLDVSLYITKYGPDDVSRDLILAALSEPWT